MPSTQNMLNLLIREAGHDPDDCGVLRKGSPNFGSRPFTVIEGVDLASIYGEDAKNLVLVTYKPQPKDQPPAQPKGDKK